MYPEIAGQWIGKVEGVNFGPLIINIDKNKSDQICIMFDDQSGEAPLVAKSFILKYPGDNLFKGNLGFFKWYDPKTKRQIDPGSNLRLPNDGEIKFEFLNQDTLVGDWSTDIGTKGKFQVTKKSLMPASPVKEVISWDQFKQIIPKYYNDRGDYYFRGHESSEYPLRSLFNRMHCWNLDRYFVDLNVLFENLGRCNNDRYSLSDPVDFCSALLLAQHHGYPTPLMDWTLSPYIAAYFAFRNFKRAICNPLSVRVFCFHQMAWMIDNKAMLNLNFVSPCVVIRPLNLPLGKNQRAISQDAVSVFSNVENIEVELMGSKSYLEYFDVDFSEQHGVLKELKSMGIYEERLFADLETVCKVHRNNYFGEQ